MATFHNTTFAHWSRVAIMLLLLATVRVSLAQYNGGGDILGTVKDQSGAMVPGATVTITNTDTNDTRTTTTGSDGSFRFPALLTGHYSMKIEKEGFKTETQVGLTLEVAQELVVNTALAVGIPTETVTVAGAEQQVDTTSSSLGGLVNEVRMDELPLNGRNYTDLTYLQPGVVNSTNTSGSAAQGGLHGTWFTSDGGALRFNLYTLDGAPVTDNRGGGPSSEAGTAVGVAGIKEYKVVTGTFDASYGNEPAAQIVMVSKGGTNIFHGEVFEYMRNNALDAANYFDTPVAANDYERIPPFKRNNFGASFGGPIKKNKTFFFAAYEGLAERLGETIVDTVPGSGCHGPTGNNTGVVTSTACPQLGSGAHSVTIAPVMQGLLSIYPSPNLADDELTYPTVSPISVEWGQIRIDQNISASDSLFGRYTTSITNAVSETTGLTTAAGTGFPEFSEGLESHDNFLTLSESHIFSTAMLNQFRVSWTRAQYHDINIYPANSYVSSVTGPDFSLVAGQPFGGISLSGYSALGGNSSNPQHAGLDTYLLTDDLYYTKGRHALKFGIELNRYNMAFGCCITQQGSVTFTSLANFLQGLPASYAASQNATNPIENRNEWWWVPGFYAQDDWKATSRLTLNLGLRYEFMSDPTDTKPYLRSGNLISITDPTLTFGPRDAFAPFSKSHFQPRVGFAWDVLGNGKTSIRSGFGIYYDFNMSLVLLDSQYDLPPLDATLTHTPATGNTTPITLPLTFYSTDQVSFGLNDYYYQNPYMLKWNFAVEQQLPAGIVFQAAYVGSRGIHAAVETEGNPTLPSGGVVNGFPYWNGTEPRINTNFSTINYLLPEAVSSYHALQVELNKHTSHGLDFQTSYTYSKDLDDMEAENGVDCGSASGMNAPDYAGPGYGRFSYGPACTDNTENLQFNALYHLPNIKSNSLMAGFVHGWWTGGIWSAQSGFPFTPVLGTNRSQSKMHNTGADWVDVATSADVSYCQANSCAYTPVAFNHKTVITHNIHQWYNPDMFTMAPMTTGPGNGVVCTAATCGAGTANPTYFGTLGNVSRGLLRGPTLENVNLSLVKDTHLTFLGESGALEFRAEFFNIFNHPNFNMPSGTTFTGSTTAFSSYSEAPSSSAGSITSTSTTSRQIQFALKVDF